MIHLARIGIYPLKSLDPVWVAAARVQASGALQHDRQFALVNPRGRFVNAKNSPAIHRLVATIDPVQRTIAIKPRTFDRAATFHLDQQRTAFEAAVSAWLGVDCSLRENGDVGFPDDLEASGPTVVSTATLRTVATWFPELTVDDVRLRFRANLEIDGVDPFAEDRLFGAEGVSRLFRIGSVVFAGINPCQRCVVPTRDPTTGDISRDFAKRFGELREATLPTGVHRERFNHYYRLSVNTRLVSGAGQELRVGDPVEFPSGV